MSETLFEILSLYFGCASTSHRAVTGGGAIDRLTLRVTGDAQRSVCVFTDRPATQKAGFNTKKHNTKSVISWVLLSQAPDTGQTFVEKGPKPQITPSASSDDHNVCFNNYE